ncbi:cytochrome P450 [Xanthomonas cerealis]|uniref:cytochrome P450 n=1 Tax=Xanthomonas cerealis TaxID=3390025 RepID=UPI001F48ECB2|nr:cytochrome P450 [Xanthomonas translucens]
MTFLQTCARDYGDVVMIGATTYLLTAPAVIGTVLSDDGTLYGKSDPDRRARQAVFPASVMNSAGSDWQRKRHALQPAFRAALIRDDIAQAAAATQTMLREHSETEPAPDMRVLMTELCARLGAGFLLGDPTQAPHLLRMLPMVDAILEETRGRCETPIWWLGARKRRARRARNALQVALERILVQRPDHPPRTASVLALLLTEDPQGRSAWCRDEVAAMLMSALEPMAAGLTWTLLLLAQHSQTAQAVADEAETALAGAGPDADSIERFPLARACVKEAMRLYPPAWLTARVARHDTMLNGFSVPLGTRLLVSPWVVHRDPRHFHDPDAFAPARWLGEAASPSPPRYTYLPFGGGPRSCIGSMLSLSQMTVVVAILLRARTLHLAADARPAVMPALVLRPLDVRIALRTRQTRAAGIPHADIAAIRTVASSPHSPG